MYQIAFAAQQTPLKLTGTNKNISFTVLWIACWVASINWTRAPSCVYSQRSDPQRHTDLDSVVAVKATRLLGPEPCSAPSFCFPSGVNVGRGRREAHLLTCQCMTNIPLLRWLNYFPLYEQSHISSAKLAITFLWTAPLIELWSMKEKWGRRGPKTLQALDSTPSYFLEKSECIFKSWASPGHHITFQPAVTPGQLTATPPHLIYTLHPFPALSWKSWNSRESHDSASSIWLYYPTIFPQGSRPWKTRARLQALLLRTHQVGKNVHVLLTPVNFMRKSFFISYFFWFQRRN